jgi:hypothetical protein
VSEGSTAFAGLAFILQIALALTSSTVSPSNTRTDSEVAISKEPSDTSRTISISVQPSSITPGGTVSVFSICGVGVRAAGVRPTGVFSTIAIGVAVCHVHVATISVVMTASRHFPGCYR